MVEFSVGPFYQAEWITASGTTIIFPSALRSSSSATAPRTLESGKSGSFRPQFAPPQLADEGDEILVLPHPSEPRMLSSRVQT